MVSCGDFLYLHMKHNKETVLITGGSGLIGSHLSKKLLERGYKVRVLSRNATQPDSFYWNPKTGTIDPNAFIQADHIIHLAGENIGEKWWTSGRKQEILDSRVRTARMLLDGIMSNQASIQTYISASAIGYYGYGDTPCHEGAPLGSGFLAKVCKHWESIADEFHAKGIRTVKIRTGLVLSKSGGVIPQLFTFYKYGLGLSFGNGKQWVSWIHIDDLCEIYVQALQQKHWNGPYNAVAPEILTNKNFIKTMCMHLRKPFWDIGIPAFLFQWILGERSELLLKGNKVVPLRLEQEKFTFRYFEIGTALESFIQDI